MMSVTSLHCWRKNLIRFTTSKNPRYAFVSSQFESVFNRLRQTSELSRRIREAEKEVKKLVSGEYETNSHDSPSPTDPESQQHDSYGPDPGSDDDDSEDEHEGSDPESFDALEERFHGLEEEVATLVADVHDLALYTKLNITGFMKILKVRSQSYSFFRF